MMSGHIRVLAGGLAIVLLFAWGPADFSPSQGREIRAAAETCNPQKSREVLEVAADGSAPYRTIQAAIDAAPPDAVIHIAAGTYDEALQIKRPVTLDS